MHYACTKTCVNDKYPPLIESPVAARPGQLYTCFNHCVVTAMSLYLAIEKRNRETVAWRAIILC